MAPGTLGTLVAIPIYWLLNELSPWNYLTVTTLLFGAGVWVCGTAARRLGVHDHPGIVWDEIVGYLVTMTAAPEGGWWVLAGFVLFRLFDIAKPFPIGLVDRRVGGGFGIMLDDLIAGLFALALLQVAAQWLL